MPISDQQWKQIEEKLENFYTSVELDCDGYRLTLRLERISTYNNAITVYIDGKWDGRMILHDCEERRRFFCPSPRRRYKKGTFKGIRKETLKRWGVDPERTFTLYRPYWTSFKRLRRHLESNNATIILIEEKRTEAA